MSRWFRFYDDALNDAKVQRLPPALFKAWVNLLCLASKHDGALPPVPEIAFALRVPDKEAAATLKTLIEAGLIDGDDPARPHNWDARQFKSDASTERVKRHRQRQCNVTSTVSETSPETDSETDSEQKDDGGGGARARPSPLISTEANGLAEEIMTIVGIDRTFIPPGWCGAPMRIQAWIAQGWTRDVILIAVRKATARKRDGAPDSVSYFEKPIAREVALQAAPLPTATVVPFTPENVHVAAPRGSRLIEARDRILARLDEAPGPNDGQGARQVCSDASNGNARLLSKG